VPLYTRESLPAAYEAGRAATVSIEGRRIASFGQLGGAEAERRKLRQPVYLAELDLEALLRFRLRQATARELSRYQAVERDFSFVFANSVAWSEIAGAIHGLDLTELRSVAPIEIWRNEEKFPGVYSALVRVVFQSQERTLRDEDLTAWSAAIIAALQALGGTIRS